MEDKMPELIKIKATKTLIDMYNHEKFTQEEVLRVELNKTSFDIQNAVGCQQQGVRIDNDLKIKLMFDRTDYYCSDFRKITPQAALKLLDWLKKYEQLLKDIQDIK
jgi:hypothetical protein